MAVVLLAFLRSSSRSAVSALICSSASLTCFWRRSICAFRSFSRSPAARSRSATFLLQVPLVTQALVVVVSANANTKRVE